MGSHSYAVTIRWTGNRGSGTSGYRDYDRTHEISVASKIMIPASSDPAFRGDKTRYNPEELMVAALSSCHMLSYLHLCAVNGIEVTDYTDNATGTMVQTPDGGGHFTEVTLHPAITISTGDRVFAAELHEKAHHLCFIANSVNFPVNIEPVQAIGTSLREK
ncbi:MAG: OsmC family protein [Longimicrobiales bacterium]